MRYAILAITATTLAIAAVAAGPVETVQLRGERAKVEDDDGAGLFLIKRDSYVFAKVGNPQRRAIAYDPARRRVRISAADQKGMWIQCAYLEPAANACPAPRPVAAPTPAAGPSPTAEAPPTKGFKLSRPAGTPAAASSRPTMAAPPSGSTVSRAPAALPDCPGDPRCP